MSEPPESSSDRPAHSPSTFTRVDLRTDLPDALCPGCFSILYLDDALCLECGTGTPLAGWPMLGDLEDPWLGRSLAGRWLVSRRLGKGATSAVYRADSLRVPRRFAVKIIDLDSGTGSPEEIWERARIEVDVVQSAENPHIVGIHEMIQPSRRHVAIVMEYIEGRDLHEILRKEGALEPARAIGILRQIALGLREVHAQGVVHRDIKPSNILMETVAPGEERARLTDFGIAHPRGAKEKAGGFIGTPLYSSPEQVLGDGVDPRSDIYSMGALVYHLLTGVPPFERDTQVKVMRAHVSVRAPRLSDAGERHFSDELERTVARLLEKNVASRPQDVDELIDLLDEIVERDGWARVERAERAEQATNFGRRPGDDSPMPTSTSTARRVATPRGHCMVEFSIDAHDGAARHASLSAGRIVASSDDEILLTTLVPRRRFSRRLDLGAPIRALGLSADRLAVGTRQGEVLLVGVDGQTEREFVDPLGRAITAVAVDAGRSLALVGTLGGDLHLLRGPDAVLSVTIPGHPVTAVAVSEDGRRFAVARSASGVEVFDTVDPHHPLARIPREDVTALALTRRGDQLAAGQATGMASVWTVPGATALHATGRDRGELLSLTFADQTLTGLVRKGDQAFLVDLGCRFGGVCTPDCTRCHLH